MMIPLGRGLGIAPPQCQSNDWFIGCAKNTDCSVGWMWALNPACWSMSSDAWAALAASGNQSLIAVPPAPTGSVLTTPPASGEQAQQTVDTLLNQQMANQQAANASQVSTTTGSEVGGAIYNAGQSVTSAVASTLADSSTLLWIAGLGLGTLGILALVKR